MTYLGKFKVWSYNRASRSGGQSRPSTNGGLFIVRFRGGGFSGSRFFAQSQSIYRFYAIPLPFLSLLGLEKLLQGIKEFIILFFNVKINVIIIISKY